MGNVYHLDAPAADLVLYGDKSNVLNTYLYNQLQNVPKVFNEFSNRVYTSLTNSYNHINDKLTQYGILRQLEHNKLRNIDNYYQELLSFESLQNANLTMQRWVIANPSVKQLYNQQNIDGYSNTYRNISGNQVEEKDYNYRLAMDGALIPTEDGWYVKHYIQDLEIGDKELTHYEKVTIRNTWEAINWIMNNCDFDFTCSSSTPVKRNKD